MLISYQVKSFFFTIFDFGGMEIGRSHGFSKPLSMENDRFWEGIFFGFHHFQKSARNLQKCNAKKNRVISLIL